MQTDSNQDKKFLTSEQWDTISTMFALKEKHEHVDEIRRLIDSGFPALALADFGVQHYNLAEVAAINGARAVVLYLQERYPDMVNGSDKAFVEALSDEATVNQLIANGYPVDRIVASRDRLMKEICDTRDITKGTLVALVKNGLQLDGPALIHESKALPLNWAARMHRAHVVESMLDAGANPVQVDTKGRHFLHEAVAEGRVVRSDQDDGEYNCMGFKKILEIAVARDISLDVQDADGNSPLHLAAKMGYMNKASLLIDYGASTKLANNKNKTPVQLAKAGKRVDTVQAIQAAAAKRTIMHAAFPTRCPRP